ncbi:MAG: hypothetical protein KBD44_01735 [Candidatus Pacebacteria bacterium]|jgi:hypothetical protein|nr:hypothetical protein [Candidatus Paceibacterota bacterium]
MNTKFIGVKDFRQNMATYAKKAQNKTTRYIVVSRAVPLFEISPFDEDASLDSVFDKVIAARDEVSTGNFYTHAKVKKSLED